MQASRSAAKTRLGAGLKIESDGGTPAPVDLEVDLKLTGADLNCFLLSTPKFGT